MDSFPQNSPPFRSVDLFRIILLILLLFLFLPFPLALAATPPAGASAASTSVPSPAPRPSVLIIRTDDLARWAVGFYGNPEIKTPNIDRIHREGASFANAFVTTPVCSPSRAGLLTGLHGVQAGITDYIERKEMETGIRDEFVTLPEIFKSAGYVTGLVGKWHLGQSPRFHPTLHGFGYFMGNLTGGMKPLGPEMEVHGVSRAMPGEWTTDLLTDEALHFIRMNRSAPFFMMLDYRSPHAPYAPVPEADAKLYEKAPLKLPSDLPPECAEPCLKLRREYYASIAGVDRGVGRILDRLEELKISESTIVVFISDNGYMIGEHGLWHKGNATEMARDFAGEKDPVRRRPNMFDDSIRIPLAIRWPGHIKPKTVVREYILQIDLFPSLPAMANVAMPPLPKSQPTQARDFSPLLRGEAVPWRAEIFGDYDMIHGKPARMRMIRNARWKLVKHYEEEGGRDELYDLQADPRETKNLYADSSTKKTRKLLERELNLWRRSLPDPLKTE